MAEKALLLGIDLGTSSLKAILTDNGGRVQSSASEEYPIDEPGPKQTEQDPEAWWKACCSAVRRVLHDYAKDRDKGAEVRGIGLSGQMHGTVLMGKGRRIVRPAIIWPDRRSAREIISLTELLGEKDFLELCGTLPATGFMGPSLMWLKEHEAQSIDKTQSVLFPKDYLRFRLCGEILTEASDGASSALFDIAARDWAFSLIEKAGLPSEIFPPVVPSEALSGRLNREAAEELELEPGIPVAAGCGDQAAQALAHGLTEEGKASVTIGTGGQVFLPLRSPSGKRHPTLHTFCHAHPERWYCMGAMLSAGLSLRWFRDILGIGGSEIGFADLSAVASESPPGADGLFFLPHLTGERSPIRDPRAKGAFIGLSLSHKTGHLVRAIMEGVCFSLRMITEIIEEGERSAQSILASGGGLADETWRGILADIIERPIDLAPGGDEAGKGAAFLGGIAGGIYGGFADLEAITEPASRRTIVRKENRELYRKRYSIFKTLFPLLEPVFHEQT